MVTGGAGYVGSHCCKAFARAGWNVVVVDNLSRGWRDAVKWGPLVTADISDGHAIREALLRYRPDLVAHFAALAYVGESVQSPHLYYHNNTAGSLSLIEAMLAVGCERLLFSSTCATFGHPQQNTIDETHSQRPITPYGWSKMMVERILRDMSAANRFASTTLRYFNAAGCDPDGEIGEKHIPETHAIPLAIAAAFNDQPFIIHGDDFDTEDGTAVRDYVHVTDLAHAHVLAAERLMHRSGADAFNLGTGYGVSVRQLVAAVSHAMGHYNGRSLAYKVGPRRAGDPARLVAASAKAEQELGWKLEDSDLDLVIRTAISWHQKPAF